MKDLKYFNTNNDYTSNKDSFEYPTVSYVEEDTKVYYMEKPEVRIVTYTTTGASQQIRLVNKKEYLESCKIVETGEELSVTGTGVLNYTFTDADKHEVELKFKDDATILASGFSGCSQLTSIPENLFNNCTKVTTFERTFYNCKGLASIPDNLFSNNTAVTDFSQTFHSCTKLTSIPSNLFINNTEVTSFNGTFYRCSGLTTIPENLFQYNTAVTDFNQTFSYCSGLSGSIPENLFSNNTAVTSFIGTFYMCSGLTGNVPVDNDGKPMYNRSGEGKHGYAIVTYYSGCFGKCTGLTDYDSIPEDWK